MKKSILFIAAAAGVIAFSSCGSVTKILTEREYTTARVLQVTTAAAVVDTARAEIDVIERIDETWVFSASEAESLNNSKTNILARAAFKTLQKYKADELIAPLYDITVSSNGTWTVNVIGYVAKFTWK